MGLRPKWICGGCGLDWPCQTRRSELIAEYQGARVSLTAFLAACFVDAAGDMPEVPAGDLYQQFLGWIRSDV